MNKGDSENALEEFNIKFPIGSEVNYANKENGLFDMDTKIKSKPRYLFCGTMAVDIEDYPHLVAARNISPIS